MISEGFITNGAKVYISSRDAAACEQACEELNALGKGQAFAIAADFYKHEDCTRLAEELGRREESTSHPNPTQPDRITSHLSTPEAGGRDGPRSARGVNANVVMCGDG